MVAIIYFIIAAFLNILILSFLPPQFKYWHLYFFSFETPKVWRRGAETYVSFFKYFYTVYNPIMRICW